MNFRSCISLWLFLFSFSILSFSQIVPSLGLKGGIAFGNYQVLRDTLDDPLKQKGLISYNVELYANVYEKKYWGAQLAVGMSTLGGRETIEPDTSDPDLFPEENFQRYSRDYIFLKGMMRAYLPMGKFRPYIIAGPSAMFLIGSSGYELSDVEPEKIMGAFHYGGGFEINFGTLGVLAEVQSKVDFLPFFDRQTDAGVREWGRDRSFWLNLGLVIHIAQEEFQKIE